MEFSPFYHMYAPRCALRTYGIRLLLVSSRVPNDIFGGLPTSKTRSGCNDGIRLLLVSTRVPNDIFGGKMKFSFYFSFFFFFRVGFATVKTVFLPYF